MPPSKPPWMSPPSSDLAATACALSLRLQAAAVKGVQRSRPAAVSLDSDDERAVVHGMAALVDDEVATAARGGGVAELEVRDAQVLAQLLDVRGLQQRV
jgi:hypothetical protein